MARSENQVDTYLEIGKSRVFAGALDWPGWCRSGRDEGSSLQALFECGPRYSRVLQGTQLGFKAPREPSALVVIERLEGTKTTDFGAPDVSPSIDAGAVDAAELRRFQLLLEVCWQAFDEAATAATGHALRKGVRGGGRELGGIRRHVLDVDAAYLSQLGWKADLGGVEDPDEAMSRVRQATLRGITAAAAGEIPPRGPRGGLRWSLRYFVRREAWHVLDHAWEIEDRVQ